jgi:tetratricopeptide (TPR) repeat protein
MRLTYIIILGLIVAGILSASYLLPTKTGIAMMKVDGSGLIESRADYETQLTVGNLSPEIVFPLVRIYLENNELNRAISLLEAYLQKNPDDIRALDRISTLYQYAGRQADYARVLEKMNTLRADPEKLKKLSDIYNYNQDYNKQIAVLEKLLQSEPDKTENYTQLAFIYRQMNRNEDAANVMKTLFQRNPKAMNQEAMESWVIALSQLGRQDDAFAIASTWLAGQNEKVRRQTVLHLSNIFYSSRRPDLSLALLAPYRDFTTDPDITIALVRAEIASGQERRAYERMVNLYNASRLPESLQELFLDVAIRQRNIPLIQALTGPGDVDKLPEFRFIQLTEFYQDEQQTDPIKALRTAVGPTKLAQWPALDAIFALALRESDAQAKAQSQLNKTPKIQVFETVALSKATMRAGMVDLSRDFLFSLRPYTQVEDNDLGALTWLMLQHKVTEEGLKIFEGFRVTRPSLMVDIAWLKMASAAGKDKEVIQWLNMHADDVVSPALLRDVYYISNDYKHPAIAAYAAKRLYWRTAKDDDQFLYATALINNGQQVEAFEHIKELKDNGFAMDPQLYSSLLYAVAPNEPKYWPEMIVLLKAELAQPNVPEERQIAVIQQLVTYNAADDYTPMIKEKALANPTSKWSYFYTAMLRKQGKMAELRAFEKAQATRPGAPNSEKRRFAYDSLAAGDKKDAAALFVELSNTAHPGNKDLEQLMYLWGTRPEEDKLDWMARRAVNAPAQERIEWMKLLYASGGYHQILRLIENIPADKRGQAEDEIYLETLSVLGNAATEADLTRMFNNTQDPKRLETLRNVALGNNYPALGDKVLEKLVSLRPDDANLLRDYGIMLYNRANYTQAAEVFKKYHAKGGNDFRTFYDMADILTRQGHKTDATPYYQRALVGAKMVTPQTRDAELITAKSLFHLGSYPEAQAMMAKVIEKNPDDKNLQADYVLLLLTNKQYDAAREFFHTIAQNNVRTVQKMTITPMAAEMSSFTLPRQHVLKVRGTQLPNEMVIQFTGEASKQPLLRTLGKEMPAWIQLTSTSYDSIVLVADRGMRLSNNFAESKDKTFTITAVLPEEKQIPVQTIEQVSQEGEIRLELLHAQLDLETGHQARSRDRLQAINARYPNNPQVLAALSSVEWYMGNTPQALGHVNEVLVLAPTNEDAARLRNRIQESRRGFMKVDGEIQLLDDDTQILGQLSGEVRANQNNVMGIVADHNYVMAEGVRRGETGAVEDTNELRVRQEVYLRHELDNGDQLKASGFFNMKTVGAGIEYLKRYMRGDITVNAEYHRSNWDFVEGVLDYVNRDRIAYSQNFRIRPDIAPSVTVGYNRYNLEDVEDVDRSVTVGATMRLPLYYVGSRIDPRLFAEYGLDAEYPMDVQHNTDPSGQDYRYYPLVTREVHYGTVGWRQEIPTDLIEASYWEAFGGYAYDRFGGNGPYLGGRWIQQVGLNKEFQLRFSHSIGFKQSDADSTRVGGYFKWKL